MKAVMPIESAKKVLITGGFGYVGSWLTRHLARAGHTVFVLSRGSLKELPELGAPYIFIRADLVEDTPQALASILPEGLDVCIHAAAAVDGGAPGYARQGLLVNSLGTRNLLEALRLYATGGEKRPASRLPLFLYCSTFHVYGPVTGHITEASPLAPVTDYALTHLFAEEYCRMFARTQKLPAITLRFSNGYGAPLLAPFAQWNLLLNDLCRSAFEAGKVVLRANPDQERDFVWLGDVARFVEALLSRKDLSGRIFNIASGQSVTLGAVAELAASAAARILQKSVLLEFLASGHERRQTFLPGMKAETVYPDPQLCVDNSAIKDATGLNFSMSLAQELEAILEFLTTHEQP